MVARSRKEYLTVRQVVSWGLCSDWPKERVVAYAAGRKWVGLSIVLRDTSLDVADRVCVGVKALEDRYDIGYWAAERALHVHTARMLEACGYKEQLQLIQTVPAVVDRITARVAHQVCRLAYGDLMAIGKYCDAKTLDHASWAVFHAHETEPVFNVAPDAFRSVLYCIAAASCAAGRIASDRDRLAAIEKARETEQASYLKQFLKWSIKAE